MSSLERADDTNGGSLRVEGSSSLSAKADHMIMIMKDSFDTLRYLWKVSAHHYVFYYCFRIRMQEVLFGQG